MPAINLTLNNNVVCIFDAYTGANIAGCDLSGIEVIPSYNSVNESTYLGYGYGYSYETTTTFNYTISINTSNLNLTQTQNYDLKLVTALGSSSVSSFSVGVTLEDEFFQDVGFLLPEGESNVESIPNVTLNNDWLINDTNMSVLLPEGTVITATDGSNLNVSAITSALTNVTDVSGLVGAAGALQFGIPSFGLTFSNPITIKIFVGNSLNGTTLTAFRALSTNGPWETLTSCLVGEFESGFCQFNTTKASYFVAATSASTTTSTTTGGVGGYCTTEWTVSEWSECTNGFQTRTVSYPADFCAPKDVKPATTQACTSSNENTVDEENVENNEATDRNSLFTGLVIGEFLSKPTNVIGLIVVLLLIVLAFVYVARKKKAAVEVISQEKVSKKTANTKKKKK